MAAGCELLPRTRFRARCLGDEVGAQLDPAALVCRHALAYGAVSDLQLYGRWIYQAPDPTASNHIAHCTDTSKKEDEYIASISMS